MFPARLSKTNFSKNAGQSLIEIIATIAVGTVLILALVALSIRSSSISDFSKAQSQAARIASEGLEIINYLKQTNGPVWLYTNVGSDCIGTGTNVLAWESFFDTTIDLAETAAGCDASKPGRQGVLVQPSPGVWQLRLTASAGDQITFNNRTFTRFIYVADTSTGAGGKSTCNIGPDHQKIKQFTAKVTWTDSTGQHDSTTTSCIQR